MTGRAQQVVNNRSDICTAVLRKSLVCGGFAALVFDMTIVDSASVKNYKRTDYTPPIHMKAGENRGDPTNYDLSGEARPMSSTDYKGRQDQNHELSYAGLYAGCKGGEWSGWCVVRPSDADSLPSETFRLVPQGDGVSSYKDTGVNPDDPVSKRGLDVFVQQTSGMTIPSFRDGKDFGQRLFRSNNGEFLPTGCCYQSPKHLDNYENSHSCPDDYDDAEQRNYKTYTHPQECRKAAQ